VISRLFPHPGPLDEAGIVDACAPDGPGIRVNFISSVDGAVTLSGRSGGLGNAEDQAMMARLRMHADVVLVGAGTVRVEGYGAIELGDDARRWRTGRGMESDPRLAIVTRSGDLPPKVLAADPILIGDPATARDRLADLGLARVLCEGGPHILGALTAADQVDELFLTLSPLLAGPGAGRITAGPPSPPRQLRLRHILTDGELLYMRFSRDRQGR